MQDVRSYLPVPFRMNKAPLPLTPPPPHPTPPSLPTPLARRSNPHPYSRYDSQAPAVAPTLSSIPKACDAYES
jgi:hypothetical protein